MDGTRLNPKYFKMGNQQPSPEEGKVQRLSYLGVSYKCLIAEMARNSNVEDIVYAL